MGITNHYVLLISTSQLIKLTPLSLSDMINSLQNISLHPNSVDCINKLQNSFRVRPTETDRDTDRHAVSN